MTLVSIEHLKQKLSLENNEHRCYNDVYKSKTVNVFIVLACLIERVFVFKRTPKERQLRVEQVYKILSLGI